MQPDCENCRRLEETNERLQVQLAASDLLVLRGVEETARFKAELHAATVRGNVLQVEAADWQAKWQQEAADRAALKARIAELERAL